MNIYSLYGLTINSQIEIPALKENNTLACDVEYRLSNTSFTQIFEEANLLAKLKINNNEIYSLKAYNSEYLLTFHRYGEFFINKDINAVKVYPFSEDSIDIIRLILSNGLLSSIFYLKNEWILHASAVSLQNKVIAFLGGIFAGKSTLAAAFCALGNELITDDLLRLKADEKGNYLCFYGGGRIRLRENSSTLISSFADKPIRKTADNRFEITLYSEKRDKELLPLKAIIIPQVSTEYKEFNLIPLPSFKAIPYIMFGLKMQGLLKREDIKSRLDFSAKIAQSIPIFLAEIPQDIQYLYEVAKQIIKEVEKL